MTYLTRSDYRYNFTRESNSIIPVVNTMAKDFVTISLNNSNSYLPNTRFFCSICNCNLSPLKDDKDEFVCTRCNVSYFPNREKVKRANKFATPGPLTDEHGNIIGHRMPIVSMVDDNKRELSSSHKRLKLPRSFEMLKRPGVNLLNYITTEE